MDPSKQAKKPAPTAAFATRSDFLSSGLAPVTDLSNLDSKDCPICYEALKDAFHVPCNESHVFDRECIELWVKGKGNNTCPTCRAVLFELPQDEISSDEEDENDAGGGNADANADEEQDDTLLWDDDTDESDDSESFWENEEEERNRYLPANPGSDSRDRLANKALRVSDLQAGRRRAGQTAYTYEQGDFEADDLVTEANVAIDLVRRFQGFAEDGNLIVKRAGSNEPVTAQGKGHVSMERVQIRLVAMANLLDSGVNHLLKREYTPTEGETFRRIVVQLLEVLNAKHETEAEAEVSDLGAWIKEVREDVVAGLDEQDKQISEMTFFSEIEGPNSRRDDVKLLIGAVAFWAWEKQASIDSVERRLAAMRQGPLSRLLGGRSASSSPP